MPAPASYFRKTVEPLPNLPLIINGQSLDQDTLVSIEIRGSATTAKGKILIEVEVNDIGQQLNNIAQDLNSNYGL